MSQNKTNKPGVESLLNTTSKKSIKWLPIPIDKYRSQMENGYFSGMQFHFKSNIAYSLQHLEFLEIILRDLTLTSVIYTQMVKDYVITSVSIIEMLFFQIAKHEGKVKNIEWRQIKSRDKKTYYDNGKRYRVAEVIYEKLDSPEETIPTFETLIQIVKDNDFLKSTDMRKYRPILKVYRQLRNKVHLSAAASQSESDYNSFDWKDYLRAKVLLFSILNDTSFGEPAQHPIFTKLLQVTKQQIKHYRDTSNITYRWMD